MSDFWTVRRIETLKRMWLENDPTSDIAEAIGATKNAVIGKAHRLGLPPHAYTSCRLSAVQIAAIRKAKHPYTVGRLWGISDGSVSRVRRGESYKGVKA